MPDETKDLLRQIHDDIGTAEPPIGLRGDVGGMRTELSKRATKIEVRIAGALFVACLIAAALVIWGDHGTANHADKASQVAQSAAQAAQSAVDAVSDQARQNRAELKCIEDWASATAASNKEVRAAAAVAATSTKTLLLSLNNVLLAAIKHRSPQTLAILVPRYVRAAIAYKSAAAAYATALVMHPVIQPKLACEAALKPLPKPKTVTRTSTKTEIRRVPGPVTVVPGPTRTITKTEPPGKKGHRSP